MGDFSCLANRAPKPTRSAERPWCGRGPTRSGTRDGPVVRRRGDYHVHIPKEHNRVCNEDHYITDIYCQTRHTFLVPYPIPLIVGVCLGGVLAFMLVGFLGYGGPALAGHLAPFVDCPSGIGVDTSKCLHDDIAIFYAPWPLYVWLSALMITLQISVLRHPKLRGRLIATLVVTLVSTVVVGIAYYGNTGLLRRILDFITSGILVNLGTNPWFYTLLNFGLILLFVADSARRWLNRARGFNPNGDLFGTLTPADENTPRVDELVSGDLIAGFVLIGALAFDLHPHGRLLCHRHHPGLPALSSRRDWLPHQRE